MQRFLPLCLLLLGAGCASTRAISGTVTNHTGEPLDRAIVRLEPGGVELVTDRQGRFYIDYLRDDEDERVKLNKRQDYVLDVFKPGYSIEEHGFFYNAGEQDLGTIALIPEVLRVQDDGQNLIPTLEAEPTAVGGATYEGQ